MSVRILIKYLFPNIYSHLRARLDNLYERRQFVERELCKIPPGSSILDAGAGSQQFRIYCKHLDYRAQDFGSYVSDQRQMLGSPDGLGGPDGYKYGPLDYTGNIWEIDESDNRFDVILCTEVFEHIPYPIDTVRELNRLLKPNGKLILTLPSNCLRHMDPYFFYTGFSDRWIEHILKENNFQIDDINAVGDYYSWIFVETVRTMMANGLWSKFVLFPSAIYYYLCKKSSISVDTMCMGYHVVAQKVN